jgi:hypothetical protein
MPIYQKGHRPENADVMYKSDHDVWAPELRARRLEITMESIEAYLHNLYRVRPDSCTASRASSSAPARPRCS